MAAGRLLHIAGLIVCLLLTAGCPAGDKPSATGTQPQNDESVLQVTIKDETFTLELALDDASRLQGLSDRPQIAEYGGMLFVFPEEEVRQFVMRRCLVPIDIAFLDTQGGVVWMHAMRVERDPDTPEYLLKRYSSHYPARFAIELKEGTIRRLGLGQGDRIELPLDKLKGRAR